VGPRAIDRKARVDLAVLFTPAGEETATWTSEARAEDVETVVSSRVPSSAGYPQASGTTAKARKYHPLVEPAIVTGLVAGLAVIFFSNRDVGN
jgi:hypothetical protein